MTTKSVSNELRFLTSEFSQELRGNMAIKCASSSIQNLRCTHWMMTLGVPTVLASLHPTGWWCDADLPVRENRSHWLHSPH